MTFKNFKKGKIAEANRLAEKLKYLAGPTSEGDRRIAIQLQEFDRDLGNYDMFMEAALTREEAKELLSLAEEKRRLEQWVSDLQSGLYINCVYCGHRYPPGTPEVRDKVLYEHIKQCPKHPLSKAVKLL